MCICWKQVNLDSQQLHNRLKCNLPTCSQVYRSTMKCIIRLQKRSNYLQNVLSLIFKTLIRQTPRVPIQLLGTNMFDTCLRGKARHSQPCLEEVSLNFPSSLTRRKKKPLPGRVCFSVEHARADAI